MKDQLEIILTLENNEQRRVSVPVGHDLEKFSETMMFTLDEIMHDIMAVKIYHEPYEGLDSAQQAVVSQAVDNLNM